MTGSQFQKAATCAKVNDKHLSQGLGSPSLLGVFKGPWWLCRELVWEEGKTSAKPIVTHPAELPPWWTKFTDFVNYFQLSVIGGTYGQLVWGEFQGNLPTPKWATQGKPGGGNRRSQIRSESPRKLLRTKASLIIIIYFTCAWNLLPARPFILIQISQQPSEAGTIIIVI